MTLIPVTSRTSGSPVTSGSAWTSGVSNDPESDARSARPARRSNGATASAWELSDLLRVLSGNSVTAVALLLAWFLTSGTVNLDRAISFIVAGIAAVILQGCVNIGWLLRGRRAIGLRRSALLDMLEDLLPTTFEAWPGTTSPTVSGAGNDHVLVAVDGATRYHLATCQLARGKVVTRHSADAHAGAGRVACGVCQP